MVHYAHAGVLKGGFSTPFRKIGTWKNLFNLWKNGLITCMGCAPCVGSPCLIVEAY